MSRRDRKTERKAPERARRLAAAGKKGIKKVGKKEELAKKVVK